MSQVADAPSLEGAVTDGFEPIREAFAQLLAAERGYSAQLCVYWRGEPVVDLAGGPAMRRDSLTGVFSATKGVAAMCIALLVQRRQLDLDEIVAVYWPEFAQAGKESITVRELLSHQAGLLAPVGGLLLADLVSPSGAQAVAAMRPLWRPGTAHGYHALTIGVFMEELVRRVTGASLQRLYRDEIADRCAVDFFLGLPAAELRRWHEMQPQRPTADQLEAVPALPLDPDGLGALAVTLVGFDGQVHDLVNHAAIRDAGPAAAGGVGSARGLARAYAACITDVGGPRLLSLDTVAEMAQQQVWGPDRVLSRTNAFGIVYMKPDPLMSWGSHRAFGHDGAGGALGFADPMYDLGFGYVTQPMYYPGGADHRAIALSQLVRRTIASLAG
jgi:CubicO group peptidase (beta-lactamase class C family)